MASPNSQIPLKITQLQEDPNPSSTGWMMYVNNGVTYKVQVNALLNVSGVPTTRQVLAGAGLTGGGALASDITLSVAVGGIGATQLDNTGVAAGTYGNGTRYPVFTVDNNGRITAADSFPIPDLTGYVPTSRQVIAGNGLTGGGALTGDVTLSANLSVIDPLPVGTTSAGTSLNMSREDHVHPAINLTDTTETVGVLDPTRGGTGTALIAPANGGIAYSDGQNILISDTGNYGEVLVSSGAGEPVWSNAIDVDIPRPANTVRAGPTAGPDAVPTYRNLVNADLPDSGAVANTYGSATNSAVVTVNSKGIITGISSTLITPAVASITGLAAGIATFLATPTSANLSAAVTDETGSGALVFANSPTLSAPLIDGLNPYISFANGSAVTVAAGRMWYNGTTGSWNLGMGGGNITQQVGEELYRYGKASAAINDTHLQIVYKTGVVGASGVITFAPAVAGITDPDQIIGCATESIALNGFGRVTTYGVIHGTDTTGTPYGEVWADNDDIWYNPLTGNPTKVKPSAPNIKLQIGTVINAGSGGSGSFVVNIGSSSALGGTDSNVQLSTLSNGDILTYNGAGAYWKNTVLTAGTAISINKATDGMLTVTNTAPDQVVALTGAGTTVVTGTYPNFTITSNDSTTGTVTSVAALTLGTTGTDLSSTVANSTTTPVITLNVPTASATNRGALSSADWSTFNGKQAAYANLSTIGALANSTGWLYNNGTGTFSYSTPTKTDVGLGNVTNDVQTKAAIVPNTAPTAGQLLVGNAGGTAYAPVSLSGDATLSSTGAATLATVNANVGSFTNASITVNAKGLITAAASGTAPVTSVTGTSPIVSSGGTTPVISIPAATTSVNGYLTSTDWNTFNNKQPALVSGTNIKTVNGVTLLGAGDLGTIGVTYGGTGQTSFADGQLLIGNSVGNTLTKATLTAGSNISITNGNGSITIAATAGAGTVTSVDVSGGTTGLTTSGGPVTTSGTITLAGTLGVANGGSGATTLTGYLKGNGTSAFTASSTIPNTDVTGLGTMSTQAANNVAITGGNIDGTTIGNTTAAAGKFTTVTATNYVGIDGGTF